MGLWALALFSSGGSGFTLYLRSAPVPLQSGSPWAVECLLSVK